jgi:hypothetical protein
MRAPHRNTGTPLSFGRRIAAGIALATVAAGAAAFAQEATSTPSVKIELNRLESSSDNCRAYFLIDNHQGQGWRSLKLDLFALDADGIAAKRLAVEVGPIPEKKTLIKLFDFTGLSCPRLGRVLLNDVMACEGAAPSREACLSAIETTSRVAAVPFTK